MWKSREWATHIHDQTRLRSLPQAPVRAVIPRMVRGPAAGNVAVMSMTEWS